MKSLPNSWNPEFDSGYLQLLVNDQGADTLVYLNVFGLEESPATLCELIDSAVKLHYDRIQQGEIDPQLNVDP